MKNNNNKTTNRKEPDLLSLGGSISPIDRREIIYGSRRSKK